MPPEIGEAKLRLPEPKHCTLDLQFALLSAERGCAGRRCRPGTGAGRIKAPGLRERRASTRGESPRGSWFCHVSKERKNVRQIVEADHVNSVAQGIIDFAGIDDEQSRQLQVCDGCNH